MVTFGVGTAVKNMLLKGR